VLLTALNDFRNGRLKEGKSATLAADLIADLYAAPTRKARVRDEAR
jgi:hypothetical protein